MSQLKDERDIVTGKAVWVGANVVLLVGATIADDAVVAVATKIPPWQCTAGGMPAKVNGMRSLPGAAE